MAAGPDSRRRGRSLAAVPQADGDRQGLVSIGLRLAVYLAALVPFWLIYSTKERGLIIGPGIGLIAALATWVLFRHVRTTATRRVVHAAVVGLIVAQLTWALGYWAVIPWIGAAALWLAFYVLSGLAEHSLEESLDRRVAVEYGVVGLIGVLVVLVSAPWRA